MQPHSFQEAEVDPSSATLYDDDDDDGMLIEMENGQTGSSGLVAASNLRARRHRLGNRKALSSQL